MNMLKAFYHYDVPSLILPTLIYRWSPGIKSDTVTVLELVPENVNFTTISLQIIRYFNTKG